MVRIYGASDDLIEIDGDWQGEISGDGDGMTVLALSDGTLLKVDYDGCWRFSQLVKGTVPFTRVEADSEDKDGSRPDGTPWYSDVLTFDGDIKWVALAEDGHYETAKPLRASRR